MNYANLGWNDEFARHSEAYRREGHAAGRVTLEGRNAYVVATEAQGEIPAVVTGKMMHGAFSRENLPVVGDWVAVSVIGAERPQATIHAVLPRTSLFSRKTAGKGGGEQPVAANIDIAFLLTGLDGNYNPRRIERYLVQTRESGVRPVVLLTKADVCPDVYACLGEVAAVAGGACVHAISTLTGVGLTEIWHYLQPGVTVALLGSSGVGKSTLLNYMLGGEVMRTQAVRADDSRGRHTTSHRQLFLLPSGASLIDTPGMRELQLWGAEDGLSGTFPEIEALAHRCRFDDCQHEAEPGCAVQAALEAGELDHGRFANHRRMQRELQHLAAKSDRVEEQAITRKWKQIRKDAKELNKQRGK